MKVNTICCYLYNIISTSETNIFNRFGINENEEDMVDAMVPVNQLLDHFLCILFLIMMSIR